MGNRLKEAYRRKKLISRGKCARQRGCDAEKCGKVETTTRPHSINVTSVTHQEDVVGGNVSLIARYGHRENVTAGIPNVPEG
jgi:hypothetical protein